MLRRYEELVLTNAFLIRVTPAEKARLEHDSDVAYVDYPATISLPQYDLQTEDLSILCKSSSQPETGRGIVIGIVDSGLDWNVPSTRIHYRGSASAPVVHSYNWKDAFSDFEPCGTPSVPCDTTKARHGTSVAGVISAELPNGDAVTYINCRASGSGDGKDVAMHRCLNFLLAPTDSNGSNPRPDLGADILNVSQGGCLNVPPSPCAELDGAIQALADGNVLVVAASGRYDPDSQTYAANALPALSAAALTIGGITGDASAPELPESSPPGPLTTPCKPDFAAREPDYWVPSDKTEYCNKLSGTSFIAPRITAAMAHLWWKAPPSIRRQVANTMDLLRKSSLERPSKQYPCVGQAMEVPNRAFGYGEIDLSLAMTKALVYTPPTPTPTPSAGPH